MNAVPVRSDCNAAHSSFRALDNLNHTEPFPSCFVSIRPGLSSADKPSSLQSKGVNHHLSLHTVRTSALTGGDKASQKRSHCGSLSVPSSAGVLTITRAECKIKYTGSYLLYAPTARRLLFFPRSTPRVALTSSGKIPSLTRIKSALL